MQLKRVPFAGSMDGALILFAYETKIKETIHKIKFAHDKTLPYFLEEETEALFEEPYVRNSIDIFLKEAGSLSGSAENNIRSRPEQLFRTDSKKRKWLWCGIPTDPGRLRRRGFDLPAVLFAEQAKKFGCVWSQLLVRTRKTPPMYGLGPEERYRNLLDCFATVRDIRGKSIVLADDIFTTGATFSAAASLLKEAGAETVKGIAFCGSVENLR